MFPVPSSYCAVVLNAIFPEAASREFLLYYNSESVHQTLTNSHDITWRTKQLSAQFSKPAIGNLYLSKLKEDQTC